MTKRLGATSVAVIPFLWQSEITVTVLDCTPQVRHGIPRKLKPVATYDDKRSALCPGASARMAEFERLAGRQQMDLTSVSGCYAAPFAPSRLNKFYIETIAINDAGDAERWFAVASKFQYTEV